MYCSEVALLEVAFAEHKLQPAACVCEYAFCR